MDETIGRSLGNESLEEKFWILGVPQIRAGGEPEGYNLSYSIKSKKFFCFNLRKKRCSEASRFRVGSKFEKFNEDPILKREALLQRSLRKLKQKEPFQ